MQRHLTDPYVKQAATDQYRSRGAYKLVQLNKSHRFLKPCQTVIDLGAAPGGWSQVAAQAVGPTGKVFAVDLLPMQDIPNVTFIQGDFTLMQDELSHLRPHLIISYAAMLG